MIALSAVLVIVALLLAVAFLTIGLLFTSESVMLKYVHCIALRCKRVCMFVCVSLFVCVNECLKGMPLSDYKWMCATEITIIAASPSDYSDNDAAHHTSVSYISTVKNNI